MTTDIKKAAMDAVDVLEYEASQRGQTEKNLAEVDACAKTIKGFLTMFQPSPVMAVTPAGLVPLVYEYKGLTIENTGGSGWAIRSGPHCLNVFSKQMDYEPLPSNRTDGYLGSHRCISINEAMKVIDLAIPSPPPESRKSP